MSKELKALIADDHQVVREGVKQILTDEFGQVKFGEAVDTAELMKHFWSRNWDFVLLDICMPGRSGLEALLELKKEKPAIPIIVLSMFSEREYAVRALKAGASGYITKQSLGHELIDGIKKVLEGRRYITPQLAELLASDFGKQTEVLHEKLSDREYEVMKLIAAAKSVKEIAIELRLSEKTVFTYRSRLLEKLKLKNDVEVARYALQHRVVD